MLSFLSGLFSQKGIAQTGADMLEKSFFTDQEKSQFMLTWLKESATPMAVARRVLACLVGLVWFCGVVILGYLYLVESAMFAGWSALMEAHINQPFLAVMGFYFLYKVFKK